MFSSAIFLSFLASIAAQCSFNTTDYTANWSLTRTFSRGALLQINFTRSNLSIDQWTGIGIDFGNNYYETIILYTDAANHIHYEEGRTKDNEAPSNFFRRVPIWFVFNENYNNENNILTARISRMIMNGNVVRWKFVYGGDLVNGKPPNFSEGATTMTAYIANC